MPLGPWMLPGGMAMVPTVGGDPRFVIDADECCCTTLTTTTTAAPPVYICPPDAYCLAECEDIYYADLTVRACPLSLTLTRVPGLPCVWRTPIFVACGINWLGTLTCVSLPNCVLDGNPYWILQVTYRVGPFATAHEWKGSIATTTSCPPGNYSGLAYSPVIGPWVCFPNPPIPWATTDHVVTVYT